LILMNALRRVDIRVGNISQMEISNSRITSKPLLFNAKRELKLKINENICICCLLSQPKS